MWTISIVEIRHAFSGKFKMLTLVFSNWYMSCSEFLQHLSISKLGMRAWLTYEPKCPQLEARDMKITQVWVLTCGSHPVVTHHLSMRVCSEHNSVTNLMKRKGIYTFHCVIRERYPIEAVQLKIHINSECAATYSSHQLPTFSPHTFFHPSPIFTPRPGPHTDLKKLTWLW